MVMTRDLASETKGTTERDVCVTGSRLGEAKGWGAERKKGD